MIAGVLGVHSPAKLQAENIPRTPISIAMSPRRWYKSIPRSDIQAVDWLTVVRAEAEENEDEKMPGVDPLARHAPANRLVACVQIS